MFNLIISEKKMEIDGGFGSVGFSGVPEINDEFSDDELSEVHYNKTSTKKNNKKEIINLNHEKKSVNLFNILNNNENLVFIKMLKILISEKSNVSKFIKILEKKEIIEIKVNYSIFMKNEIRKNINELKKMCMEIEDKDKKNLKSSLNIHIINL